MKKLIKLLPVAAGIVALTGCVNDDIPGLIGGKIDYSDKYVLKVNVESGSEDVETRGYWNNSSKTVADVFAFGENDLLRVYDSKLQKYDDFKLVGKYFAIDKGDAQIGVNEETGKLDYAYALHAEGISIGGWNNGSNMVFLEIPTNGVSYGEMTVDENGYEVAEGGGTVVYKHAIPMWGTVEATSSNPNVKSEESEGEKTFETTLHWLTTRARVIFENGAQSGVKAVRAYSVTENENYEDAENKAKTYVTSLSAATSYEDAIQLASAGNDNLKIWDANDQTNSYYVANENAPLSGTFAAMLEGEGRLNVYSDDIIKTEQKPYVEVSLDAKQMSEYTSVVWLPITFDFDHEIIVFEYTTDGTNWNFLRLFDFGTMKKNEKLNRNSTIGGMTVTTQMTCTATTLSEVNDFLAKLNPTGNMVISFTNKVKSFVVGETDGLLGNYEDKTLVIPSTWNGSHKITLNFDGAKDLDAQATGLITCGDELKGETVKHKTSGKKYNGQTLTPATMEIENKCGVNVEINVTMGTNSTRYVKVNVTKNEGTVTLGKNVYSIKANEGSIVVDASNTSVDSSAETESEKVVTIVTEPKTKGEVTIAESETKKRNTSVAVVGGTVKSLEHNGNGDVTVTGNATVTKLTNNGTGDVTIKEGANFDNLVNGVNGGKVTVTNKGNNQSSELKQESATGGLEISNEKTTTARIKRIIVAGGNVDITNAASRDGLTINGASTVIVKDYITKDLTYTGNVTYKSFGKSAVLGTVTKEGNDSKITFSSDWDGYGYSNTELAVDNVEKSVGNENVFDVYTAAELSMLLQKLSSSNMNNLTVNIYADIELGGEEKHPWTGIEAFSNVTGIAKLVGNSHTISNVNIALEDDPKVYGHGFINGTYEGAGSFEAEDLTLEGVNTDAFAGEQTKTVAGIGGFIGAQWGKGTYKNIVVKGTNLGVTTEGNYSDASGKFIQVGGLIGKIYDYNANGSDQKASETVIESCKVEVKKISGKWSLGGLVGDARGRGDTDATTDKSINLVMKKNTVNVQDGFNVTLTVMENETNDHYGRVGMLLGTVSGGGSRTSLTFGDDGKDNNIVTDCIVGNQSKLKFGLCTRYVPTGNNGYYEKFVGKDVNDKIYVGYSPDFDGNNRGTVTGLGNNVRTIQDFNVFEVVPPTAVKGRR